MGQRREKALWEPLGNVFLAGVTPLTMRSPQQPACSRVAQEHSPADNHERTLGLVLSINFYVSEKQFMLRRWDIFSMSSEGPN